MRQYPGYVRYAWKSKIGLFYLYAAAKAKFKSVQIKMKQVLEQKIQVKF